MTPFYAQRTVAELLAAGRLSTRMATFLRSVTWPGSHTSYPYKAPVYEVVEAKGRRRKATPRPKPGEAKPTVPGPRVNGQAPPKATRPYPRMLSEERRQELRTRILAHLAEYGPCPLSEIRFAVSALATETDMTRVVDEPVAEGQVDVREADLSREVRHGTRTQRVRYRAKVCGLARGIATRVRRPRRSPRGPS